MRRDALCGVFYSKALEYFRTKGHIQRTHVIRPHPECNYFLIPETTSGLSLLVQEMPLLEHPTDRTVQHHASIIRQTAATLSDSSTGSKNKMVAFSTSPHCSE